MMTTVPLTTVKPMTHGATASRSTDIASKHTQGGVAGLVLPLQGENGKITVSAAPEVILSAATAFLLGICYQDTLLECWPLISHLVFPVKD